MNAFSVMNYSKVVGRPYSAGAIIRNDFPGFREDYLVIHCLLRRYRPQVLMEIGTSTGNGTNVICKALGVKRGLGRLFGEQSARVLSIDVPPGTDASAIYPEGEDGHPSKPGSRCRFPYTQLLGDSTKYDFRPFYPIHAWFIDGKHSYDYAKKDTEQALLSEPELILWHDLQIVEVEQAVLDTMANRKEFELYRVGDTRIGFGAKGNF